MNVLLIILILIVLAIVIVQIGKVSELASAIRDEEEVEIRNNNVTARLLLLFGVGFLVYCVASALFYKPMMLGYASNSAASAHGTELDNLFDVTLFFTGVVFFLTHIALFWFAYRYRRRLGHKAVFYPHNNTLEIWWSVIPAVVMFFLVIRGLVTWNKVMADVGQEEEYIEVEATGYQFAWHLRYPGPDDLLGRRDYTLISGVNPLGQDWQDPKNLDDIHPSELVLPVNRKVRVRITARDVLHNFYLPHFRVKMDAVPGMPTYFVFTPTETTAEYREKLRKSGDYDFPFDETDPESQPFWREFNIELACAELCGSGHWSMRRIVRIVTEEEYQEWLDQQSSYYLSSIRGTDADPLRDQELDIETSTDVDTTAIGLLDDETPVFE
jgi:cytochrome c oxidase subunit 2